LQLKHIAIAVEFAFGLNNLGDLEERRPKHLLGRITKERSHDKGKLPATGGRKVTGLMRQTAGLPNVIKDVSEPGFPVREFL
jgi:hypothetical protein